MPRPRCWRRIGWLPECRCFQPAGKAVEESVVLELDELEALRLADLLNLHQEEAAAKMDVSRPTFGRILEQAHRKVAEALVEGKALEIKTEGGNMIVVPQRTFVCYKCGHTLQVPYGEPRPGCCPVCSSRNLHRAPEERGWRGPGWGRCRWSRQVTSQVSETEEKESK